MEDLVLFVVIVLFGRCVFEIVFVFVLEGFLFLCVLLSFGYRVLFGVGCIVVFWGVFFCVVVGVEV